MSDNLLESMSRLTDSDWLGSNPLSPQFRADPYPGLRSLREKDPVNLTPIGVWRLTKYDDINQVFKNFPVAQTLADGSSPNFDPLDTRGDFNNFMLNLDGPEHLRLRRLVIKAFTGNAVKLMEKTIEEVVATAMERGLADGGMDICTDLAVDLPSRMTCRIMGIPDTDRLLFLEWAGARTKAFWARFLPEDEKLKVRTAGAALADYFELLVKERKRNLGDDLVSGLIRAEEQGDRLKEGELIIQVIGLLVAAYETTIGLISNGLLAFIKNPEMREILRERETLLPNAIDECLRYDAPVVFNWRVIKEPVTLGDKTLPADSVVWLMLGAGNRDPAQFPDPDIFDITRSNIKHLAFGGGPHFCLGNQFARAEGVAAIGQFLNKAPQIKLKTSGVEWSDSFFRVLKHLPVEFY
ncbi:MAG: cytochrome P450 [Pseudomonadota bacterium]|nr:cytochrome P450 [Pseudomonadota bacterium]